MVDEIVDDAPCVPARQLRLGCWPGSPAGVQDCLLALRVGAVVFIGSRQSKSQGPFEVAQDQFTGDKRCPVADTAEALVVEVIRNTHVGDLRKRCLCAGDVRGTKTSEGDLEAVNSKLLRGVGNRDAAQIRDLKSPVRQILLRTIVNREVLNRVRVPIFEPAMRKAAEIDLPPSANCGERIGRRPAALLEAIKCERAGGPGFDGGNLIDPEVVRLLLELHSDMVAMRYELKDVMIEQ